MAQKPRVDDVLPLSPMQEGMLFHALFDEEAPDVYTGQVVLGLDCRVDAERLRTAAQRLLARHANLRAEFRTLRSGRAVQVLRREVRLPWRAVDLTALAAEQADHEFERLAAADRSEPFDPARPPLLRLTLVTLPGERHRLLLTSHHLLWDGWSAPILVRELVELYATHGDDTGLPRVPPYRDYLAWLTRQDRDAARSAWRATLADLDGPTLVAPSAARHPEAVPDRLTTELTEASTAALSGAARVNGLTVNTVLQGLWALLLSKLTGRTDVVFGTTVSGRSADVPGIEQMVGLLINTLPVRATLRPGERLVEFLGRLQAEQARLLDHQYLGLSDIQQASGHATLFDTLVVLESYPVDDAGIDRVLASAGLRLSHLVAQDATHYPLTLTVLPGRRTSLVVAYQNGVFDAATVATIAGSLRRLVHAFVSDPQQLVGRVAVAPPEDLADPGGPVVDGAATTVRDLVEAQVRRTPDATAVRSAGGALSYAELDRRADRMAGALLARGAGPECTVAVALPRSLDLVVALLAVLKSGAAYLPIDVTYPRERIELMLDEAAAPLVVCTEQFVTATGLAATRTVPVTDAEPAGTTPPAARPQVLPDHPAYVIFTSGSTGRPKGVVGTQRALANRLAWGRSAPAPATPAVRVSKSPVSFVDGTTELLTGLVTGDTVVVADDATAQDPLALVELVDRHGVGVMTAVPSLLATLVESAPPDSLQSMTTLIASGEPLPARLARALTTRWPRARLVNLYGCSEATGDSLAHVVEPGGPDTGTVEIGRPIANTTAHVLDPFLQPVPAGMTGELYLAGAGLARGYLHRPGRTAERFVANPFGPPGSRLYRTGDLAVRRADGVVEFAGRADGQVKVRGFRIEPAEVEAAVATVPGVRQVAVAAYQETVGEGRLVAYVVTGPGTEIDPRALRRDLASRVPAHLVPSAVVVLDELPRTPSGKLDRGALPEPDFAPLVGAEQPRTEREELLCGLVADVLGLDRVGVGDNFFELGGHSVASVRLVSRARGAGLVISPRDVFVCQTVAELARVATATGPADEVATRPAPLVSLSPPQLDKVLARWRT